MASRSAIEKTDDETAVEAQDKPRSIVRRCISIAIIVASLTFIGWHLVRQVEVLKSLPWTLWDLAVPGLCSLLYLANGLVLIFAWRQLLVTFSGARIPFRVATFVFGRSQIAKYLPGNVAHLAWRHGMGRKFGVSHAALFMSSVMELAGLLIASVVIGITGYSLSKATPDGIVSGSLVSAALVASVVLPLVTWFALRHLGERFTKLKGLPPLRLVLWLRGVAASQFCYTGFFLLMGVEASLIASQMWGGSYAISVLDAIWITAFAYAVGTITPGAPGGLGVREATMLLLLRPYMDEAAAAVFTVMFRIMTSLGDVWIYVLGMAARRAGLGEIIGDPTLVQQEKDFIGDRGCR